VLQTPWFLVALALTPALARSVRAGARDWLVTAVSVALLVAVDPLSLWAIALALIPWLAFRLDDPWRTRLAWLGPLALLSTRAVVKWQGGRWIGAGILALRLVDLILARRKRAGAPIPLDRYLAWATFFPVFSAGPVEPFARWTAPTAPTGRDVAAGGTRVAIGIAKRALVGDLVLQGAMTAVLAGRSADALPLGASWAYVSLALLSGYVDFSAYSDLAVGGARILGHDVLENFDWPVLAVNLPDFWRRWHRSLLAFCQSAIYLPAIGRTRSPYLATYATFALMGLWHAPSANWLCWGLYHATGMALYVASARLCRARRWWWPGGLAARAAGWAATMAFVSIASAFTTTADLGAALRLVGHLVGVG
jgi:D-alanyl-lipoteichoic acid acyltransferase DltB (MBOAT superfamily)